MRIDGRKIAEQIRNNFKSKNIVPKIAIITLGPESSWATYVRQKIKVAKELGIDAVLIPLEDASEQTLLEKINHINNDPSFHGMIVQRPLPQGFDRNKVVYAISLNKDIDGFRPDSKFEVPVWLAVKKLIEYSLHETGSNKNLNKLSFAVIGKGETAGGPVIRGLSKMGIAPNTIDTKTENPDAILKNADVIISCVGKSNVIRPEQIKKGAIVIGVGIHTEKGKLCGDYDEKEVEQIASAYTPTPGGVGPVNLAYLFKNLIEAAKNT